LLIERREYVFRPGGLQGFLDAQSMLGFDAQNRPTLARLINYFVDGDRVVHYWRFDDYDDWMARLHRRDPGREPYFRKVRPLMLEQENRFLLPAPVAALTPLWGNGNDWLPGAAPVADLAKHPQLVVEEHILDFDPGALPEAWEALRTLPAIAGLLGCLYTLVGRQHEIILLRWHADRSACDRHAGDLRHVESLAAKSGARVMMPAPLAPMSPLFRHATG
jgi:hypothetical protein